MTLAVQKSATAYARMLRKLLPPGRLWRVDLSSYLMLTFLAAGDELTRVGGRALDLIDEADPRTTSELLPDFERMLGLEPSASEALGQAMVTSILTAFPYFRPVDIQETLASLLGQAPEDVVVIERNSSEPAVVADAQEIYQFFVYRDPLLPGTYFVDQAQQRLDEISHSHTNGDVIESLAVLCDDPYSLTDRDPLGHDAETVTYFYAGVYELAVLGTTHYLAIAGGGGTEDHASQGVAGGGGGACSQYTNTYSATEFATIVVGVGGDATGGDGGDSSITDNSGLVCLAKAGTGGLNNTAGIGGPTGSGVGDILRKGGDGGLNSSSAGGGGGGAGGATLGGGGGTAASGGTPGTGGSADPPGASGGDGGASGQPGQPGGIPGGGAGGEGSLHSGGAVGGLGRVIVDLPERPYKYEELF